MKLFTREIIVILLVGTGLLGGCERRGAAAADEARTLNVFAAASTTEAMARIGKLFGETSGIDIRLNAAASSTLARQIEAGAPAAVFLSADQRWMDYLAQRQLIEPATRIDLLANRLVLIAAPGAGVALRLSRDVEPAGAFDGRLAVGDPSHVPAGRYAKEALDYLGWWDALEDRLAPAADVRAALRLVETGQAVAGIVYSTDAAASKTVGVVDIFPPASHRPIRYPVAVCSAATDAQAEAAGSFLAFLRSPAASKIFAECGFETLVEAGGQDRGESAAAILLDDETRQALWLSAKVGGLCAMATLVPGVALGWLLARRQFRGKGAVSALVHAPLVVPPVVVGYAALLVLGRNGPVGRLLDQCFGIELAFTWLGAAVVAAVMAMPLMVRSVRLAIELVDKRLEQAAATLGSSPLRVFATVTLPLAAPGVLGGLVLAFARSLGEFGATITFAGNIAGQTRTLPLAIYSWTQTPGGDGRAIMLAMVSVALSLAAIWLSEHLNRRLVVRAGSA